MPERHEPDEIVDRSRCRLFEEVWTGGHARPIEEFLPDENAAEFVPTLEELIHIDLEYRWKSQSEQQSVSIKSDQTCGPIPIESYLERFPCINQPEIVARLLKQEYFVRHLYGDKPSEQELQHRFPGVSVSELETESMPSLDETVIHDTANRPVALSPSAQPSAHFPCSFGEYELLEQLGQGGMGVVFKARQRHADRVVALKVIRSDRLKGMSTTARTELIERFRTEARATARLEHDNIVTVFDVGEFAGEHFYSMHYVEGNSLLELMRDGPISNRQTAEYLEPVARAVHFAHQSGILHRDLKPHNIMVESRSGRPLVADFGLAKLLEGHTQLTHDGDVIGTPSYMSPEQATASERVTTLSDVYAVGATMYHLLTGRPPFKGANVMETIHQVLETESTPPSQFNSKADRDLETICLKCLQKEPAARYASAEDLADDLARFLKGEPILARPVGRLERAVRWAKRNRATAIASAAALFGLVAALTASTIGYFVTKDALRKSDDRLKQARDTVDGLYIEVSESDLLNQPGMRPLRQSLLEKALAHYQLFVEDARHDKSLQDQLAATWFRIGRISEDIDSAEEALTAFENARSIQQRRLDEEPDSSERMSELALTLNAIGAARSRLGQQSEAYQAFSEAQGLRQKLVDQHPHDVELKRILANTLMNIGVVDKARGEFSDARQRLSDAQAIRMSCLPDSDSNVELLRDLAMGSFNQANLEIQDPNEGDFESAKTYLADAINRLERLLEAEPQGLDNRNRLAICYRTLADLQNDLQQQVSLYTQAADQLSRLVIANPRVVKYRESLTGVLLDLGRIEMGEGSFGQAETRFQHAIDALEPVLQNSEKELVYFANYATALQAISAAQIALERPTEALQNLRRAGEHLSGLVRQHPEDDGLKQQLASTNDLIERLQVSK